jgi:hypothetical protein
MKKFILTQLLFLFFLQAIVAQNIIKGITVESESEKPLQNVLIRIVNINLVESTAIDGAFILKNMRNGLYILEVKLVGYETQNFPIELSGATIDLGRILLYKDIIEEQDLSLITITDDELNDDANAADNISGLLQASKDLFLRTAAFEFSSSFFRIKGLDSGNGKVLINGIEMNKIYDGRAQWSNWGG